MGMALPPPATPRSNFLWPVVIGSLTGLFALGGVALWYQNATTTGADGGEVREASAAEIQDRNDAVVGQPEGGTRSDAVLSGQAPSEDLAVGIDEDEADIEVLEDEVDGDGTRRVRRVRPRASSGPSNPATTIASSADPDVPAPRPSSTATPSPWSVPSPVSTKPEPAAPPSGKLDDPLPPLVAMPAPIPTPAPAKPEPEPTAVDEVTPVKDDTRFTTECLLDPDSPGCGSHSVSKPKEASATPEHPNTGASLPEKLTDSQIRSAMAPLKTKAKQCAFQYAAAPGTKVRVKLSIQGETGKVLSAEALPPHERQAVGQCVADAFRDANFPRFSADVQGATFPVTL